MIKKLKSFLRNRKKSYIVEYPTAQIKYKEIYDKNVKLKYDNLNVKYNDEFIKLLPRNYIF